MRGDRFYSQMKLKNKCEIPPHPSPLPPEETLLNWKIECGGEGTIASHL